MNVGVAAPQAHLRTGVAGKGPAGLIYLYGGAIQLELMAGPAPVLVGRRPIRGTAVEV